MGRLKSALLSKYHDRKEKIKIYNPKNCEEVKIPFKGEKIANVCSEISFKETFIFYIRVLLLFFIHRTRV